MAFVLLKCLWAELKSIVYSSYVMEDSGNLRDYKNRLKHVLVGESGC